MRHARRFATVLVTLLVIAVTGRAQVSPDLTNALQWRGIGPAATGGRIADIAVSKVPGAPAEIYVGTTSGGVFKSVNEGVSFAPIFDNAGGMMSIGAVAVSASNPAVVWVGTGETDNRQSSSWGDGIYRSIDAGRTWQKMGLEETRHIGRVVIHPKDPNIVYAAAAGHLWGSNPERGVFKTTDGGRTWNKVLFKDEYTGAIDLVMDPHDPQVLYAAMYQHQRKGWGYNGGGPGSGIYRTTDGGTTWTELRNGLPRGDKGRIGLAVFPGDPHIVYAIVEADAGTRIGDGEAGGITAAGGPGRAGRGGPAQSVSQQGGVFRSADQGETWQHMIGLNPRPSYYSRIFVDPKDAARVYILGSNRGFYMSDDSGRSFRDVFSGVHGEDHALWVDPENTNRLIIGGDGGVSISYDRGLTWLFRINLPIGQFYNISVNNQDPYLVCGGLQDNGSWCTPSASGFTHGVSFKDAFNIGGGDGMQAIFEGDDHTVLVSSQNGVTNRLDLNNMQRQSIGPVQPLERPAAGRAPYRWYWTTPLIVSSFDANTIYTGANILFRSDDRGLNWRPISSDLTANIDRDTLQMMGARIPPNALSRHDGQSNFSALTVIAESPLDRNLLYTGADDGTLQMTRDGGKHWTNLSANVHGLPPMLNISGIVASKHSVGRVYLTVDGHFNDDYHPYVYVSEDYGKTWRAIVTGLPQTSVHRLREHPSNPNFLVVGTEMGVDATFDRGGHWSTFGSGLPPVPVYDLLFQERSHALVLGTHGRSIWVLDHIEPLVEMTPEVWNGTGHLFSISPSHHQNIVAGQFWFGAGEFFAPNPASGAVVSYFLPPGAAGAVQIQVSDAAGKPVRTLRGPAQAGLNRICWDLRQSPALGEGGLVPISNCVSAVGFGGRAGGPRVPPGKYTVTVTPSEGTALKGEVTVLADPRVSISAADRTARWSAISSAYSLQQQLVVARDAIGQLSGQIAAMRSSAGAPGEGGRSTVPGVEQIAADVTRIQGEVNRTLASAASVQSAVDGYEGPPTGAQLRQLEWAWEDAVGAVNSLNQLIRQSLPPVYASLPGAVKLQEIKPVPVPSRKR